MEIGGDQVQDDAGTGIGTAARAKTFLWRGGNGYEEKDKDRKPVCRRRRKNISRGGGVCESFAGLWTAEAIIRAAKEAGADAVKLQTYTPDTITLDCDNDYFQITQGTIWDGTTLHKLYEEAYTPWEWQPKLMELANGLGMECFSSPFDATAVDFMREMDMPAYKVASFEINDIPLIRRIARIGKPIIFATGIAYLEDIERALAVCKEEGNEQVILLKCTSTYPSPYEDMNLKVIPHMAETFDCLAGLSDHSMGTAVAVAGVALGAKMVEKHLTLSRADGGRMRHFPWNRKNSGRWRKRYALWKRLWPGHI